MAAVAIERDEAFAMILQAEEYEEAEQGIYVPFLVGVHMTALMLFVTCLPQLSLIERCQLFLDRSACRV
jgi:hypothetical protein